MAIKLDSAGIAAILKSAEMTKAISETAEAVAQNVRSQDIKVGDHDGGPRERELPVVVQMGVSDRARAQVTIAHPSGEAVQAKHGALTKAAAAAGLKVRSK